MGDCGGAGAGQAAEPKKLNHKNGESCFVDQDCAQNKCSQCPLELQCGTPINAACTKDSDCCDLKCVQKKCTQAPGNSKEFYNACINF